MYFEAKNPKPVRETGEPQTNQPPTNQPPQITHARHGVNVAGTLHSTDEVLHTVRAVTRNAHIDTSQLERATKSARARTRSQPTTWDNWPNKLIQGKHVSFKAAEICKSISGHFWARASPPDYGFRGTRVCLPAKEGDTTPIRQKMHVINHEPRATDFQNGNMEGSPWWQSLQRQIVPIFTCRCSYCSCDRLSSTRMFGHMQMIPYQQVVTSSTLNGLSDKCFVRMKGFTPFTQCFLSGSVNNVITESLPLRNTRTSTPVYMSLNPMDRAIRRQTFCRPVNHAQQDKLSTQSWRGHRIALVSSRK